MYVHRYIHNRGKNCMNELLQCLNWAHFDQLLAKVVTKLVSHDIRQNVEHTVDDSSCEGRHPCLWSTILDSLLNHPTASLIECKHFNLLSDINLFFAESNNEWIWQNNATAALARLVFLFSKISLYKGLIFLRRESFSIWPGVLAWTSTICALLVRWIEGCGYVRHLCHLRRVEDGRLEDWNLTTVHHVWVLLLDGRGLELIPELKVVLHREGEGRGSTTWEWLLLLEALERTLFLSAVLLIRLCESRKATCPMRRNRSTAYRVGKYFLGKWRIVWVVRTAVVLCNLALALGPKGVLQHTVWRHSFLELCCA